MRLLGKHVFPRQIVLLASGLLFLCATTYDVHRSIKNNEKPPTKEQIDALQSYVDSKRSIPPDRERYFSETSWCRQLFTIFVMEGFLFVLNIYIYHLCPMYFYM
ncbi:uncharacterized protein LOC110039197 [Phalaenopsis equestris]|uniref:uncharacterized protein LOC110039197 n=1 Tax=Phalaenopsis equestris TaxID=78828 RepID=UPI0009E49EA6|nr:uncharacterized protein LOC110039197 [Phalaenopsis equestris]